MMKRALERSTLPRPWAIKAKSTHCVISLLSVIGGSVIPCSRDYRPVVAQRTFLEHPGLVRCETLHAREVGKRRCAATGHSMRTTAARTSLVLAIGLSAGISGICVGSSLVLSMAICLSGSRGLRWRSDVVIARRHRSTIAASSHKLRSPDKE
jgi:hypothetical protein